MFALAYQLTHSVQALFTPIHHRSSSRPRTTTPSMSTNPRMHNDMYFPRGSEEFAGLRLAFKGPLANDVGVVRASGPSRVTAQEIAARFPSADIGLPGHPSIIIESINSNSSAKRCPNTDTMGTHGGKVMHMPARTRRTHISAMEVASRFAAQQPTRTWTSLSASRVRGAEVKRALARIIASLGHDKD